MIDKITLKFGATKTREENGDRFIYVGWKINPSPFLKRNTEVTEVVAQ